MKIRDCGSAGTLQKARKAQGNCREERKAQGNCREERKVQGNCREARKAQENCREAQKTQENCREARGKNASETCGKTGFPETRPGPNCLSREEKARRWGGSGIPALLKPGENRKGAQKEKAETASKIVVRPDGSRVLLVTVRQGGAVVRAMSLRLSEPAQLPDNSAEAKTEERGEKEQTAGAMKELESAESTGTGRMPGSTGSAGSARTGRIPVGTELAGSNGTGGIPVGTGSAGSTRTGGIPVGMGTAGSAGLMGTIATTEIAGGEQV